MSRAEKNNRVYPPSMMLKAVLFKLDDILIDFVGFKKKGVFAAARVVFDVGLGVGVWVLKSRPSGA